MLRETVRIEPAEAYVEKVVFSDAPPVAFHVRTKVELGKLGPNRALLALAFRHLELSFLSGDTGFVACVGAPIASYGTKMSGGADDEPGLQPAIGNPTFAGACEAG